MKLLIHDGIKVNQCRWKGPHLNNKIPLTLDQYDGLYLKKNQQIKSSTFFLTNIFRLTLLKIYMKNFHWNCPPVNAKRRPPPTPPATTTTTGSMYDKSLVVQVFACGHQPSHWLPQTIVTRAICQSLLHDTYRSLAIQNFSDCLLLCRLAFFLSLSVFCLFVCLFF